MKQYMVRAVRCSHRNGAEEVKAKLSESTESLTNAWEKIEHARKILIKTNMIFPPDEIRYYKGVRREHVDDSVMRAVLELLRERTNAELCVIDTTFADPKDRPGPELNFKPLLDEFGVRYIDASEPRLDLYEVDGGGFMFNRYYLHKEIAEADAFISVAKLKSHLYAGLTGCVKNLFGLLPLPPHGTGREYYHHIIRLPYVLVDLAKIMNPCLNIIDGLLGQSGAEWGGDMRITDALIAGDHPIATDACGGWLMGHDLAADWPTPPFRRDRNHLLIAAERGFGTTDLSMIDFKTNLAAPLADFNSKEIDPPGTVWKWRRTMCEQALFYRENREQLLDRYANEFLYLQDGEVVWHGPDFTNMGSRRELAGSKKESALWLKKADPEEIEGERFEVYDRNLEQIMATAGKISAAADGTHPVDLDIHTL